MKRLKLDVTKRTVLGKQVRKLRREGLIPATIYGKDVKSVSVQLPSKDFEKVFKDVGETGLIDLNYDSVARPVLIHNVQIEPLSQTFLHADFYQVNLKEKIKSMIPVEIVGEPIAVADKVGLLLQTLQEIEVEALPEELPEKFEVNVEKLALIDDQITVGDLKTGEGVEILSDKGQVVAKITDFPKEEVVEAPVPAEGAEGEEAAAEGGQAPAEGEIEEKPTEKQEPAQESTAKE